MAPVKVAMPWCEAAEQAVLGDLVSGVLPQALEHCVQVLEVEDFYRPAHQAVFASVCALWRREDPVNAVSVMGELRVTGGDKVAPWELVSGLVQFGGGGYRRNAAVLGTHTEARKALLVAEEHQLRLAKGEDPVEVAAWLRAQLAASKPRGEVTGLLSWDELLDEPRPPEEDWAIPGLLRRNNRAVLVGPEGKGKSTLCRMVAMAAGQGVHPFTQEPIDPIRTLVCDYENPRDALLPTAGQMRSLCRKLNPEVYDPTRAKIFRRPSGADLRQASQRRELEQAIYAQRPDLVVIGPAKNLFRKTRGESGDDTAKEIQDVLDDLRGQFNFALILEHHAPLAPVGSRREWRPKDSSTWLSWPDFGYGMIPSEDRPNDVYELVGFRGDRVQASWPDEIYRSSPWPWSARWNPEGDI